jgi:hypothetical protein
MQRCLYTILIILLTGSMNSVFCQPTFDRLYGTIDDDAGNSILKCSAGGYLISGTTSNFMYQDYELYLVRLNEMGDTTWTHVYPNPDVYDENALSLERPDQTYLVMIQSYSDSNYSCLRNIDDSGQELWSKWYSPDVIGAPSSIILASDNDIVISGTIGTYLDKIFICRTDSLGNVKWSKAYGGGYNGLYIEGYNAKKIIQTKDNGFMVCGYKEISSGLDGTFGVLAKFAPNGDSIWMKSYQGTASNTRYFLDIIQKSDGSFIASGVDILGFFDYEYYPFLMKISPTGITDWTRYYPEGMEFQSLSMTNSGSYILTGFGWDSAFMARADSNGTLTWSASIASKYGDMNLWNGISTAEGNFLFTGNVSSGSGHGGYDMLVLKTNEDGIITNTNDFTMTVNEPVLKAWPNPCTDFINVSSTEGINSISVIDFQGNSLLSRKKVSIPAGNSFKFPTSQWPAGLYQVRCDTDKGVYYKLFIKL